MVALPNWEGNREIHRYWESVCHVLAASRVFGCRHRLLHAGGSRLRAGCRCRRSGNRIARRRDHRYRYPGKPRQFAEYQAQRGYRRGRDHGGRYRRLARPVRYRGAPARAGRVDQPLRRFERPRPLLGRGFGRRHSRPQLRTFRIQWTRLFRCRGERAGDQFRGHSGGADRLGHNQQERDCRPDRRRPRRDGQSEYPQAVRQLRVQCRFQPGGELRRHAGRMDTHRQRPSQQYLGNRWRHLWPARQRLLFPDQEPGRRHPGHQLPDPRWRFRAPGECAGHLCLP